MSVDVVHSLLWTAKYLPRVDITVALCVTYDGTRQNVERGGSAGGSPLVSFDHVIDPHFVTFSSSLYTTISNPNPNANPNTNPNANHIPNPNPNPNHNPNPNRNPTAITDPQIGPIDPQIVTIEIRPADLARSAFCRVPFLIPSLNFE